MSVTCDQMRALEAAALASGLKESELMDEAGAGLAMAVTKILPRPEAVVIFAGKGHNAGDAWVAARHWLAAGWRVAAVECFPRSEWRPLTMENWRKVSDRLLPAIPSTGRLVLVDALLGIGAAPPLRPPILDACHQINALRDARHATTVAVDGPTGVHFDTGEADESAVRSDLTVTVGEVKCGLLAEAALNHVGRLCVVPVPALTSPPKRDPEADVLLTPHMLRPLLPPPRPYDFHKGKAGRVLIVAGSRGMLGAARLCSAAAVHGGAGLVTLAVPVAIQDVAAGILVPEVMVLGYRRLPELTDVQADVIAVGPGLGRPNPQALADWLAQEPRPVVVDADGLNALAAVGAARRKAAAQNARAALASPNRLLTPHPGEMRRLLEAWAPTLADAPRASQARELAAAFGSTIILKGSRSLVATPNHPLAHNSTGHPGMASGGMGDVLTGLCAALLPQGASLHDSGCLASWLLGRAAELALSSAAPNASPETLRASLVLDHIGPAFGALRFTDA